MYTLVWRYYYPRSSIVRQGFDCQCFLSMRQGFEIHFVDVPSKDCSLQVNPFDRLKLARPASGWFEIRSWSLLLWPPPGWLTTPEEVETWMTAPADESLKLQRPLPDGRLLIVPTAAPRKIRS